MRELVPKSEFQRKFVWKYAFREHYRREFAPFWVYEDSEEENDAKQEILIIKLHAHS